MRSPKTLSKFLPAAALALTLISCKGNDDTDPPPVEPECTQDSDCASNDCNETTGQCVDLPSSDCVQVAIEDLAVTGSQEGYIAYEGAPSVEVDASNGNDIFSIQFYQLDGFSTTGAIDLASAGINDNYATCTECVLVYADIDDEAQTQGKIYFQEAGTLNLSLDPYQLNLSGSLEGLKLIEVTINGDTYESTPVANGSCIELVSAQTLSYTGWTCDYATTYGTGGDCDCECGAAVDPDCQVASPTVAGCEAGETCGGEGMCIPACDLYTPTACTTGTCVSGDVLIGSAVDYCETNAALIDTATIGTTCVDQINTYFCAANAGLAMGVCVADEEGVYQCEQACRTETSATDCPANFTCTAFFEGTTAGSCKANPTLL